MLAWLQIYNPIKITDKNLFKKKNKKITHSFREWGRSQIYIINESEIKTIGKMANNSREAKKSHNQIKFRVLRVYIFFHLMPYMCYTWYDTIQNTVKCITKCVTGIRPFSGISKLICVSERKSYNFSTNASLKIKFIFVGLFFFFFVLRACISKIHTYGVCVCARVRFSAFSESKSPRNDWT